MVDKKPRHYAPPAIHWAAKPVPATQLKSSPAGPQPARHEISPRKPVLPPPTLRPLGPKLQMATQPVAFAPHPAQTVQRASSSSSSVDMGFGDLKVPTGYGAVVLSASLNGINLGKAWSKKTTYSDGTEHAEDAVIDFVEELEFYASMGGGFSGTDPNIVMLAKSLEKQKSLVIANLTASPCSTTFGTCAKGDAKGCTERLIALKKRGYTISISADHYYQPSGVTDAKEKSKAACAAMTKAGITVTVSKT